MTRQMIVAVTSDTIYLLDRKPTKVPFVFHKNRTSIKSEKQGATTTLLLSEDGASAEIQANLGFLAPNKTMNQKLIKELGKADLKRQ